MSSDEQEIVNYLKKWPRQFLSGRDICRRAAGKWRFRDDPYWATQPLLRLVEKRVVETDAAGHFRLAEKQKKRTQQKWISPQLQKILEENAKKQAEGPLDVDKPEN